MFGLMFGVFGVTTNCRAADGQKDNGEFSSLLQPFGVVPHFVGWRFGFASACCMRSYTTVRVPINLTMALKVVEEKRGCDCEMELFEGEQDLDFGDCGVLMKPGNSCGSLELLGRSFLPGILLIRDVFTWKEPVSSFVSAKELQIIL